MQDKYTLNVSIKWENCTLRSWLNSTFLNDAFSEAEQDMIPTTHLTNPKNLMTNVAGGNNTDDKIFLLGLSDVYGENTNYIAEHWYFNKAADRIAYATKYTVVNRSFNYAYLDGGNTRCNARNYQINRCLVVWWLRSPGHTDKGAAYVSHKGGITDYFGNNPVNVVFGVRPALWVQ